jgi:hypothetical protein
MNINLQIYIICTQPPQRKVTMNLATQAQTMTVKFTPVGKLNEIYM